MKTGSDLVFRFRVATPAIQELIAALTDQHPGARARAADALGGTTKPDKSGNAREEIQAVRRSSSGKLLPTDTFAQTAYATGWPNFAQGFPEAKGAVAACKVIWGCQPLVLTLAETGETLRIVNRSGHRPSQEGTAEQADQVIDLYRKAGFRQIRLSKPTRICKDRIR